MENDIARSVNVKCASALFKTTKETKHCPFSLTLKTNANRGEFFGYASVFDVEDLHQDAVVPGAFSFSLKRWGEKKKWPFLLWQHDMAQPIGYWKNMREDSKGLFVEGQLLLDVKNAWDAYHLMKQNIVNGLSIGFYPVVSKTCQEKGLRRLLQIDLIEVSLVTMGANPYALVENCKGLSF